MIQILGSVRGTVQPAEHPADEAAFEMSRERFLRGVGGTVVALGVPTGTGVSIASVRSASHNGALEALKAVKTTDLTARSWYTPREGQPSAATS